MITDISNVDVQRLARRARGKGFKRNKPTIKETSYKDVASNMRLMETLRQDWDSLYDTRRRYQRTCKFHRGDQWSDLTTNDAGEVMTEASFIREQGKLPLKQNIIRPLAKSLAGLFRSETGKPVVISRQPNSADAEKMLSNAVQYAHQINNTKEVDARTYDIYLLSGLPIQKTGYDFIPKYKRYDIVEDYIDPQYIFFNTDIKDVRLKDLRRIGQLHDITKDELYSHFAKNDADKKALDDLYKGISEDELQSSLGLSADRGANLSFYIPDEPHKCRVIEVWEKKSVNVIEYWDQTTGEEGYWEGTIEEIDEINEALIAKYHANDIPEENWLLVEYDESIGTKWFFKYLTPYGHVLREGETPYDHGEHPYTMYPYPLINGEVWGPIEDVIDQQKYINRLITLWDFIMGTSAKNTLILDENSLNGKSAEEIGVEYRRVGGTIVLDLAGGAKPPFELGGKLANLGITELIGMQIKWMQDISGVQPAMQGQTGNANTPASKYAMEIQQTTLNNRDLMESFQSFRRDRDMKVLQTIIQFYRSKRYLAISGRDKNNLYDPELIKDEASEYDLVIGQSMDSPTYKSWMDEMLKEFVMNGMIDIEMFLNHSNLPIADALLEDLRNKREQVENGSMSPQEAVNGLADKFNNSEGVDQANINRVSEMVRRQAA